MRAVLDLAEDSDFDVLLGDVLLETDFLEVVLLATLLLIPVLDVFLDAMCISSVIGYLNPLIDNFLNN